jgi:hypothetical protein
MLTAQGFLVALIVAGCCIYAAWTLMPTTLRRSVARRLQKVPLPALLARKVTRAANASTGCGCDGCDRSEVKPAAAKPITFHRQARR